MKILIMILGIVALPLALSAETVEIDNSNVSSFLNGSGWLSTTDDGGFIDPETGSRYADGTNFNINLSGELDYYGLNGIAFNNNDNNNPNNYAATINISSYFNVKNGTFMTIGSNFQTIVKNSTIETGWNLSFGNGSKLYVENSTLKPENYFEVINGAGTEIILKNSQVSASYISMGFWGGQRDIYLSLDFGSALVAIGDVNIYNTDFVFNFDNFDFSKSVSGVFEFVTTGGMLYMNDSDTYAGIEYNGILYNFDANGLAVIENIAGTGSSLSVELVKTNGLENAGAYNAYNYTFVAVPEPSMYAAVFGAIALAFAAYRRRK